MAMESSYTIAPLSPETWSAFDALVARHNGTNCVMVKTIDPA
jgi:hypothetical protein